MTLRGVDLSTWQTSTPDLTGLSFVIARATYGTGVDDRYYYHAANARRANLSFGAYAFGTSGDGAIQARVLLTASPGADFWVLDLEANGADTMPDTEARRFIRAVQATGRKVGLYHSLSGFPHLGQDWDWVAAWDGIDPGTGWTFHQYRGAPLDLDEFNGDAAAFAQFLANQRSSVTKPSISPAAEPVVWTGLITSVLLGVLQYATGHGLITADQGSALAPQVAFIANGIATMLPVLFSLITRQVTTPTSQIPAAPTSAPVASAPAPSAPSLPVSPSAGVSPVATINSSSPLSANTEGTIGAGTKRWALDGEFLGTIGPSTLSLVSLDFLTGNINGHFYRTGTAPNVYVEYSAVTLVTPGAPAPAPRPAAPISAPPTRVSGVSLAVRSTDSYWYMRQLLELEAHPELVATLSGIWPSEATIPAQREQEIPQLVGDYIASGPYYNRGVDGKTYPALPNSDVLLAARLWQANAVGGPLNPVVAAALTAAVADAANDPAGFLDFGTDKTLRVINIGGSWGDIPVSGRYGTLAVLGM